MSLKPTDIKYYVHTNKGATPLSDTWGALISVLDSCLITGFSSQTVLTSEILTGNILKLTYSADHNYLPGQVIKITGANQLEFNVEFRISIVPSTTTLHIDITEALSNKGISGTLTTVLPSLGWSADYTGTGKRAYRNADVIDTARPYLRVVDEKDTLWNSTYAKYAKSSAIEQAQRSIYSIEGIVVQKEKTNIVRLYSSLTNQLIRTISTDDLGNYSFNSLPQQSYFVIIRDKTKQYNAVIQDNIVPK